MSFTVDFTGLDPNGNIHLYISIYKCIYGIHPMRSENQFDVVALCHNGESMINGLDEPEIEP